ncbi:MAG: response regulator transcription factor [Deltaproteobacteria bacterium]|nr:response regulator transcription factor [Deltaproteobacteria bacterium]
MIKVFIVDDHAIIRRGLKQIIADATDMFVAGEAPSISKALEQSRYCECDVIVLGFSLPDRSGLDVLKGFRHEQANRPVLVLTMYPEEQIAIRAFKAGAAGYLTKECSPEELIYALRKVADGGKYVSPVLAERLASRVAHHEKLPHEFLSDREYQVLHFLATGKTVSEIARQLTLSVKTISTYRARLLEKMSLRNNAELMRYALTNRLFE